MTAFYKWDQSSSLPDKEKHKKERLSMINLVNSPCVMAIFHRLSTSSLPPASLNLYQRIGRTSPAHAASFMPTTNKWSIAEDHTLISNPSNHKTHCLGYPRSTEDFSMKHEEQLKETRNVLREVGEDPFEGLVMIDALQRLGIDYHFEEEIGAVLHSQYVNCSMGLYPQHDLHEVSTRFRLLRQNGYNVSIDVFNNFRNKDGKFKSEIKANIRGLMSLYEASQLSIEGEDILDQAAEFTAQLLNLCMPYLDHHRARVVGNTLQQPYHKSLARFLAKSYLGDYRGPNGWVKSLQPLAKIDFQMVQSTHQKEILQVSKWWRDTRLSKELKFARNRPLKWYMWPMAALTDPILSEQRVELTKPISFVYLIDDIFDVYGTMEELTLFTEVINRWDVVAAEQLPDHMKICFKALDEMTNKFAYRVNKRHGWNPIDSLRKTWASLCNAFLVEAKWLASGQLPKAEEYLKNGIITSGVHVVLVHTFFFLGHGIDKESVDLATKNPGIMNSVATILRLSDDMGSAKDENQEGLDGSYIECYMNDHKGSSAESAREKVIHMISDEWKRLNQECLHPSPFSKTFTKACLNTARVVPLMYNYDDNRSLPILEEHMKSILDASVYL